tara:strand:- start:1095 stop:1559 length:465 start_codon:yes stop_codon:yes gene_type:complete
MRNQALNGRRVPVPEDAALFPIDGDVDAATLVAELGDEYDELADADTDDPFHIVVLMLARRLSRRLDRDELTHAALEQAVQLLTAEAFESRAIRFGEKLGETRPAWNLEALVRSMGTDDVGANRSPSRPFARPSNARPSDWLSPPIRHSTCRAS